MVNMFHSKCNNRGRRTFFDNKQINDGYVSTSSRTYSYTSQVALYDFNRKVKYVSQLLNRIVYHDYNITLDILQREYNIMIFELNKLKSISTPDFQVILNNIITTFETQLQIYNKYVVSLHADNIVLPDNTYDNITGLKLFVASLKEATIPLIYNDRANEELEMVLFKLYTNVGSDLEELLKLYSSGNFTKLHEELTYEVYSQLSRSL